MNNAKYQKLYEPEIFVASDLSKASHILRDEYPNGPVVASTIRPEKSHSYNEISQHIRQSLLEISKSIY